MIETFIAIMSTNAVAQGVFAGALAAAPMTALVWFCKDVPMTLWEFGKKQISQKLIIFSYTDDYREIVDYAQNHIIWSKSHQISDSHTSEKDHEMGLGVGVHWGRYKGVYFRLDKEQQDSQGVIQFKEKSTLTFYTRNKNIKKDFFDDAIGSIKKDEKVRIRENAGDYWDIVGTLSPRPWESVVSKEKEKILAFVENFKNSEQDYLNKGIPYHTGILLHGIPGTGKTSIIHALAYKLKRDVCYLNPNTVKSGLLMRLLSGSWENKILVIEDIDVSGAKVTRGEVDEGFTLSELLNSLDGIATPHGMITVATTNDIHSLDPALIRPGRFDYVVEIGKLDEDEARELAAKFGKTIPEPYQPMTGVQLRNYFLKNNS